MSAGLTPILGLPQFDANDDLSYTEVSDAYAKLDKLPTTICTSTTRPITSLYAGRTIFETNTGRSYMWNGTAWVPYIDYASFDNMLSAWSEGNATFTASGTNPNIGATGTNAQRYKQIGQTVYVTGRIALSGAGASLGAGTYAISLPVAPGGNGVPLGYVWVYTGAGVGWVNHLPIYAGTGFNMYFPNASGVAATPLTNTSSPGGSALTTSMQIRYALMYEAS